MPRLPRPFGTKALLALILALLGIVGSTGCLRAAEDQKNLQLEVTINGIPSNAIGSFAQLADGRLAATPNELAELGINAGKRRFANELVQLDDIPSLRYRYEERTQKIDITIDNLQRQGRNYDLRTDSSANLPRAPAAFGGVLNYDLLSATTSFQQSSPFSFAGTSLTLDARAFSPYGTFSQSAIVRSIAGQGTEALRLDTSYRYSDPERLMTYRAGDEITGGLGWTRPIRIGGLQAQRNFLLRPDLVTVPLPLLGGTAAVPSTVDLYVNNIKTFSQDVGAGPFSLSNVPVISGSGNASLVVRDAAGHVTTSTQPFYSSPSLLAPELMSFSVEAGLPRLSYGSFEDSYLNSPVGSATLRRGIFDGLTLEAHAEAGSGLLNGGVGAVFLTGTVGVASAAIAASTHSGNTGLQSYLSYETRIYGVNISMSSQRTFNSYDDLASVTARFQNSVSGLVQNSNFSFLNFAAPLPSTTFSYLSNKPPRALDRISVGMPMLFDEKSSISASFIHLSDQSGNVSNIVTGSWSRALPYKASIFATVFTDFSNRRNTGVFAGLTYPFSDSVSLSSSVSSGQGGTIASLDAVKPLGPTSGSFGWRVHDSEGATAYREASVAYRSDYARIQAGVSQNQTDSRGMVEVEGAAVMMGGGVFLSNRIDDAFAVVQAGVPNVQVYNENRPIGITDAKGLLLVPTLRSYQSNKITIDPSNLPVDVSVENTREIVAPADRSGVLVNFGVHTDTTSALVVFKRPDGSFIPAGTGGHLEGGEDFVIGYDGQAYIGKLTDSNTVRIELSGEGCVARFYFTPRPGEQVLISPVVCQ
jgi:outer membrane usher protein